jgi:hypothetical protein
MFIMAALLVIGFICNLAVKPVPERYYMAEERVSEVAGSRV